jgi:hypothetical protein
VAGRTVNEYEMSGDIEIAGSASPRFISEVARGFSLRREFELKATAEV